jgi:release factor glutamine methyltransferase
VRKFSDSNLQIQLSLSTGIISRQTDSGKVMGLTIADALLEASQVLRKGGVAEARREAGSLLSYVIGRDRTYVISHAEDCLSEAEVAALQNAVERRATGEPLQYITGCQDFYGREFKVTPSVLIPRPETELLVEAALQIIKEDDPVVISDVGTGSGCIAVTILCERPKARAFALDISPAAIDVAKENSSRLSVGDRVTFVLSDCFAALDATEHQFDLVLSNPPYVAAGIVAGLQREVRDHEPQVALSPGPDGLAIIRRLLLESPVFLKTGGHLIMEIGFDQGESVRALVDSEVWRLVEVLPDLQGIPRIVVLRKNRGMQSVP